MELLLAQVQPFTGTVRARRPEDTCAAGSQDGPSPGAKSSQDQPDLMTFKIRS